MTEFYHNGPNAPTGLRTVYTHNDDGTITFTQFKNDLITQDKPNGIGLCFLDPEGEVNAMEQYNTGGILMLDVQYTYDTKKHPSTMSPAIIDCSI
ncbi:MAG TPA: hypothetical protein VKZ98_05395 [Aquaticitalea sp.]|nr:hypothetical protein [Aquaticitalea sp.]